MLTNDIQTARDSIQQLQKLLDTVNETNASIKVTSHVAYRLNFAKGVLRSTLVKRYLAALERVRSLSSFLAGIHQFDGAKYDMNMVGSVLRRIAEAREELNTSRETIRTYSKEGVI